MGHDVIASYQFLSGAAMFGAFISGTYFFRFWSKTRDRLFLIFGIAFWIMALERVVLVLMDGPRTEDHAMVYLIRLLSFVLILFAVADKNRRGSEAQGS